MKDGTTRTWSASDWSTASREREDPAAGPSPGPSPRNGRGAGPPAGAAGAGRAETGSARAEEPRTRLSAGGTQGPTAPGLARRARDEIAGIAFIADRTFASLRS